MISSERTGSTSGGMVVAPPCLLHAVLILSILSCVAFANTLRNGFVWDDRGFVEGTWLETHRAAPLSAFTRGSMEGSAHWKNVGYYRPLVTLSMVTDFAVWGRRPAGYHLTNIALHAACVLLAFALLHRTLDGGWVPFLAAALFALHPVHAESVAFVSGRTDLLYTLFLLVALHLFLDARSGRLPGISWPGSLFAFAAALLCKETAACAPLLMALLLASGRPGGRKRWLALVPYLVLLLAYLFVRLLALPEVGTVTRYGHAQAGGDAASTFLTMPVVLVGYLKTSLFPVPLAVFRDIEVVRSLADVRTLLTSLAAVAIFAAGAAVLRHRSLLLAWGFFLLPLLPVSNLIPIGTLQADRYLYLPALGVTILIAVGLVRLILRRPAVGVACAVGVGTVFLALTVHRNEDWRDDLSLWRANVRDCPGSIQARLNLGAALGEAEMHRDAAEHYREVVRAAPRHGGAWYSLGWALEKSVVRASSEADAERLRGEAERAYGMATSTGGPVWAHERLGMLQLRRGETEKGVASLRAALPASRDAFLRLADIAREEGDREEEAKLLTDLLDSHPSQWEAALRLGELHAKGGRTEEARAAFARVLMMEGVDEQVRSLAFQAMEALRGE